MSRQTRLAHRRTRAARVNAFVTYIGSVGRRFWASHRPRADVPFGRIEVDDRGRPWWLCPDSSRRIYLLNPKHMPHVGGGTLTDLLLALTGYVMRGERLDSLILGPWPTWVCGDGDRWGYGLDTMASVRAVARALGVLAPQPDTVHLTVDVDVFTTEWLDEAGISLSPPRKKGRAPMSRGGVCARLALGAAVELASGMSRRATRALLGSAVATAGLEQLAAARLAAAEPLTEHSDGPPPTAGLRGAELEDAVRAQLEGVFPTLVWAMDVVEGADCGSASGRAVGSDVLSALVGFADDGISLSLFGSGAEIEGWGHTVAEALEQARQHLGRVLADLAAVGVSR